jgi:8-oxo-dGTP pyrophosphatase MutT (NUDIX family)
MGAETRRAGGAQFIPRPEGWRLGALRPWPAGVSVEVATAVERVRGREAPPTAPPDVALVHSAAVLIVLVDGPDGAEVLLTRRSAHLRSHRGEVSFPGGRGDPGETPDDTALREAWEEVALDPSLVTVVGRLDPLQTFVTNSYIVPVVGTVRAKPELIAEVAEVDRIFWVPLVELTRMDTFQEEWWQMRDEEHQILFFHLDDETVWGATARMLLQLLSVVLSGPS